MKIALLTTDDREHFKDYSCPRPYFGMAPEALLQGFALFPEIEVHVVSCLRQPVQSPEKLAGNIWYHALQVPKAGWMTTAYSGCIRAVRKKLHEIQPDIVHGQGTERDCAISAVFGGFPNVLTIHGNMAEINRLFPASEAWLRCFQWGTCRLEDYALKTTSGVFCNSAYTEKLVAPRAQKTWRVPNPIRAAFFEAAPEAAAALDRPIVNVGVVSPRKRQLEMLQLAEEIYREGGVVPFLFVGSRSPGCPYGDAFEAEIKKAEAAGYAFHIGAKKTDELIQILDRAGAMLHFPTEESFGLVVAEALARNLKFFGTAVGGILDIASGMEGVELYEKEDWEGLKAGIKAWLAARRPKPAEAAAAMAERYHPRQIALRHLEIYREVLNKS